MPTTTEKRSHHGRYEGQFPCRAKRRVNQKGQGLKWRWPEPQGDQVLQMGGLAVTATGESWNLRHAGMLRRFHQYAIGYATLASRWDGPTGSTLTAALSPTWETAKMAWWKMFRLFFIDTTQGRGPRNDWILPDDIYPPLPRVPPWIVQSVVPAFGWPEFLAQVDEQLGEDFGWSPRQSGNLVEVQVLKPPQTITSTNDDGAQKVIQYEQKLYRLSSDFVNALGNTTFFTELMEAVIWHKFDAPIAVLPSFGIEWVDFAADTYQSAVVEYVAAIVNQIIAQMEFVYINQQRDDLGDTGLGGWGGLLGLGDGGEPEPTGGPKWQGKPGGTPPAWAGKPASK